MQPYRKDTMQQPIGDKRYLYVQHSKDEGISVIDVSEPAKAKVIRVIPWPDPAVSSHMNVTGDLALITENEGFPVHAATSKDDLVLWDLSNPTAPQVVRKFSGVVRFLLDNRNFIYVLNSEGLWVISMPDREPEQVDTSSYGG
jgi:LVIVD repeat-containing protein